MWNDIENITKIGIGKIEMATAQPFKFFMRSCMAGAYLAMAAILSYSLGALFQENAALSKTLVAGSFGIGLAMIVFLGGELFTGNCFTTIMPVYTKKKKVVDLIPSWLICYFGNCLGSAIICAIFIYSGSLKGAMTMYLTSVIQSKLHFDVIELILKGILCNFIVCVGAYTGMKVQDSMTKLIFLVVIVMAFVLPGFEHCIANAGTFTMGVTLLGSSVNWAPLPVHMLLSTFGNIIGGSILFGLPIYLTFKD